MSKLNVIIVGFGFMGKTHARTVLSSKKMNLVAVVDTNVSGLEEALKVDSGNFGVDGIKADELAAVKVYSDFSKCVSEVQADAVLICVHTLLHHQFVEASLKLGLHVFVEKPFVLNASNGQELISLAKVQNKVLMVGHVVRFMPAYKKLKELVSEAKYGELEFISLTRFTGVPAWGEWKERQQDFGSSGGALFDLVIHDIDYLHYLLGHPNKTTTVTRSGALSNEDYICSFWKYEGKSVQVKVEGGDTFHTNFPFEASYKAQFEKATLVWSSSDATILKIATNNSIEQINLDDPNRGFTDEVEYFAECILGNKEVTECTPESALDTIKLCYKMKGESV